MQVPTTPARPARPDSRTTSSTQPAAGPSSSSTQAATTPAAAAAGSGSGPARADDLWTEILRGADRQKSLSRKNVVLLSERHRGRRNLLSKLVGKRRAREAPPPALAIGYDVLEHADRDEDAAPPVSVFYPPSSHPGLLRLVDVSLPPHPLPNTAVVIVLDWTKPSTMVRELLAWLAWVDQWAQRADKGHSDGDELRERLQSHLQHYTEPPASNTGTGAPSSSIAGYNANSLGTLLPLGPGTLTLNPSGIPIVVVCTRADLMDHVGDEMGMKGGGWEERTDWIQQVLRTVCLAYGAALFYTAPTQPQTYTLLREYLFHRLYSVPPPLTQPGSGSGGPQEAVAAYPSRFPFPHRANVLDRDAVLVPAGWDSWGKINVLRDGFDPARVGRAWESSATKLSGGNTEDDAEGIEDLWFAMVPDTERPKPPSASTVTTTSELEQTFLARQLDVLLKDPNRDARAAFRHAANSASAVGATAANSGAGPGAAADGGAERYGGVVGPMGTGGLSLPGVERAMAEMEGAGGADDVRERFGRIARREPTQPTSPTTERPAAARNEALHNFFQGLVAKKSGAASTSNTPAKPAAK